MIMLRRHIQLFSQEYISNELGLTIPKKYKNILPHARVGKRKSYGWGTQVQEKQYSINKFFKKHKIQLHEKYYTINQITNPLTWIREQIEMDNDLIVCFKYSALYRRPGSQGHVSIVHAVDGEDVVLIDPIPDVPKYRKVNLYKLLHAIEDHGKSNRGGFWLISPV